jgi:hypothetical protein
MQHQVKAKEDDGLNYEGYKIMAISYTQNIVICCVELLVSLFVDIGFPIRGIFTRIFGVFYNSSLILLPQFLENQVSN